jgi:hypothetical protein
MLNVWKNSSSVRALLNHGALLRASATIGRLVYPSPKKRPSGRPDVLPPVQPASFGRCVPKKVIELICASVRPEERLLLLGRETHPKVVRSSLSPDLA